MYFYYEKSRSSLIKHDLFFFSFTAVVIWARTVSQELTTMLFWCWLLSAAESLSHYIAWPDALCIKTTSTLILRTTAVSTYNPHAGDKTSKCHLRRSESFITSLIIFLRANAVLHRVHRKNHPLEKLQYRIQRCSYFDVTLITLSCYRLSIRKILFGNRKLVTL